MRRAAGEADRDLVDEDADDGDGAAESRGKAAQHHSISVETRRMKKWATRGNSSFSRMYSAANGGRMRRYFPSSAALQIARATRSGFTARISREAPGIFPRSAFSKNSVSVVPGQTRATRTPRPI